LTNDLQQPEFITKSVEGAIVCARSTIAKAQVLIRDNDKKLDNEKMRAEKLEVARDWVQ